jgi:hypothetical protein
MSHCMSSSRRGRSLARAPNSTDGTTVRDWAKDVADWMPQIGIDFLEAVMLSARQTTQQVPPVL